MGHGRPEGLHLSTVIKAMKEAAGEKVTGIAGEDPAVRPLSGFLWERAVEQVYAGVPHSIAFENAWREYMLVAKIPVDRGEVQTQIRTQMNGILMTPDGLDADNRRLESYKATWRSMRKWDEDPEEHFWPWLKSEMAYIHSLNEEARFEPGIRVCRFFILWMNGDYSYRPGKGPQATFTDVEFEEAELETNWKQVLRYAEFVKSKEVK